MLLGEQIQYVRRLKNMERKEVAEKLGISIQQYSKYENSKSHVDEQRLDQLSQIFNVDKERILEIDTQRILQQINNDNGIWFKDSTVNFQDTSLITRLLDNQNRLIDMMDKWLSALEGYERQSR
jgi:transcriptional regulator with XRE-family HTH domain